MIGENLLKIITFEEKLPTKNSYIELIILLYTFDTQPSVELPSKQPTSYVCCPTSPNNRYSSPSGYRLTYALLPAA